MPHAENWSSAAAADGSRASTSLPPRVRGSPRGFLALSVDSVVWYATSREFSTRRPATTLDQGSTLVRLAWWGEQGQGSVWAPESVGLDTEGNVVARHAPVAPAAASRSQHGHRETEQPVAAALPQTIVYPIVVSPSSLMNYLADAQWLVFELHHFAETDPSAMQRDWLKTLSRAAHASRAAPQSKPPLAHCMFDLAPLTESLGLGAREWQVAKNVPIVISGVPVGHVSLRVSCRIQGDASGAPTTTALGDAPRLAQGFDALDDGGFGAIPEPAKQRQTSKPSAPVASSPLDDFPSNVPFTSSYRGPPPAASDPIRSGDGSKLDARDAFDMANINALIAESEAVSKGIEQSMAFVPNRVVGPAGSSAGARDHEAESTPSPSLQASPMKAAQPPQPHPYPQRQQAHSQSMRERDSGAAGGAFDMAASLPPNGGFSASSSRSGPPPSQTPFVQHSFSSRAPAASAAASSYRPPSQQQPAASAAPRLPAFASTPAASYIADFAPAPSEFFGGPSLPPAAAGPLPPPFALLRPATTRTDPNSAIDEGNLVTVWIKLSRVAFDAVLDAGKQSAEVAAALKQHQAHRQHLAHSKGTLDSQRRGDYLVCHYSLFPEVGMARSAPVFAPRCSSSRPAILGPHWDSSPRVFSRSWLESLARACVPIEVYAYKKRPSWKDARDPVSGKFLPQAPLQTILARAEIALGALASLPLTLPAPDSFPLHDPARESELIRFLVGCTAFNGRISLLDPSNPLPTPIGSLDVSFGLGSAQSLARLQKMESAATMLQRAARGFLERRRARRRKIARGLQREQEEDAEEERLDAEEAAAAAAAAQQQQQDQYASASLASPTGAATGADSHRSTFSTPSRSVSASPRSTAAVSGGGFAAAALRAQAAAHGQTQQQLNFRLNLPLSPSSRGGAAAGAPSSARKSSLASSTHAHDVATSPLPHPQPPLPQPAPFVPAPRAEDKKDFVSFSFARGSRSSALQSIGDQKREQSTRSFADSLRLIEQAREDLAAAKAGVTGRTPVKSPAPAAHAQSPNAPQGLSPPHSQLREKEREAQERAAKLAEDSWMQQQQHRPPQPPPMQQPQMASPPRVRAVQPSPPRNHRSAPAAPAADSDAEAYSDVSDFEDEDYDEEYAVSTESLSPPPATAAAARGSQLVSSFDPSDLDASTARERLQQQLAELGELQRRLQWRLDGGRLEDLPKQQTMQQQQQQQQQRPQQQSPASAQAPAQPRSPPQLQPQHESKQSLSPPRSAQASAASVSGLEAGSTPSSPAPLFQSPQPARSPAASGSAVSSSPSSSDLPHLFRATELSSLLTITPMRNTQQQQQRAMAATPNTPTPFLGFSSPSPPAQQTQQQTQPQGERRTPPAVSSSVALTNFAPSALPPAASPVLARGSSESSIPEVLSVEPPPAGSERVASPPLMIQEVNIDTRLPPQPQQTAQQGRSPPVNRWLEHGHLSPSRIGERAGDAAAPAAAAVTRSSPAAASASVEYSDYGSDVSSGSSGGESDSDGESGEEDDRPRRGRGGAPADWSLRVSAPPGMAVKVQYMTEPQSSAEAAAERARLFPQGLRGAAEAGAEPGAAAAVPSRAASSGSTLFLGGHSSSSSRWDARFQPTEEDARRAAQIARIMQQHSTHTD